MNNQPKSKPSSRSKTVIHGSGLITDQDVYLFKEGKHFRLFDKLGAHPGEVGGVPGIHFAVWAPNARSVSVTGDFNRWDQGAHPLAVRWDGSGIWEGFIPGILSGSVFKYHIISRVKDHAVDKGDPFAFRWEVPPHTASLVWSLDYVWKDAAWMERRQSRNALDAPQSIYEIHLGSWRRDPDNPLRLPGYRELADQLVEYIKEMGFTHVEFLPIMEHPFYGSWGYQITGYFAPTSRYGTPQEFMELVDILHRNDIGVILDWVPSHFPDDEHGLAYFDGTHLYEHADPRQGFHPEWKSLIFNLGRNEVGNFLISNALFWLEKYHIDGLRVDAVASMLYLDYARQKEEWIPNRFGGRENLEAIDFIRNLNKAVYELHPDVQMIAEESTAWPMVSHPVHLGGLGFGEKWNMGWMHDTLEYFSKDPIHRKHHFDRLTFSLWYAFTENFILPLSHDEVVYGKKSLLEKMPGDDWRKFANLRLLLGWFYTHPGKKLLFMGGEFGQRREWGHDDGLDWDLLTKESHAGVRNWVKDLNRLHRREPALHTKDFSPKGFEWIDCSDTDNSILVFLRKSSGSGRTLMVICNLTPVPRYKYRVGFPSEGFWKELLNSDAAEYGGSGVGNLGGVPVKPIDSHGRPYSALLTLPPLSLAIFAKNDTDEGKSSK